MKARTARQQRTQWAAQFLAASELVRRGYVVSFTMGNHTPTADLMVGVPESGLQFWVDVKGLSSNNAWLIKQKPDHLNLFYILVRVGTDRQSDRFFILEQAQINGLLERSRRAHPNDPTSGFGWSYPAPFEDKWTYCRSPVTIETMEVAQSVMESAPEPVLRLSVPLKVDARSGDNWEAAH